MNKKYKKVAKVLSWILAPFFLVWVMLHGYSSFMIQKYGCLDPSGIMDDPTTSCDSFNEKVAAYCSLGSEEFVPGSTGSSVVKLQLLLRSYRSSLRISDLDENTVDRNDAIGYLPAVAVTGIFGEVESSYASFYQKVKSSEPGDSFKSHIESWCKDNYQQIKKQETRDTKQVEVGKKFFLKVGKTAQLGNLNILLLSSYETGVAISSYKGTSGLENLQTVDVSQNKLKVGESSLVGSYKITLVSTPTFLHRWPGAYFMVTN